jgi:sulfur-carrier protein
MPVTVRVPGSLKAWLEGQDAASCHGDTLGQCIDDIDARFPGFKKRLVDDKGGTSSVLIFLNGDNIGRSEGLSTAVKDGDEIYIIPLAAGG